METRNNGGGSAGVGFAGLLTIVFITLKLLGYIDWSWIWVLSPIWLSFGLVLAIMLIVFIVVLIKAVIEDRRDNKKK